LPASQTPATGTFARGRILVGWRGQAGKAAAGAALQDRGFTVLNELGVLAVSVVEVPEGQELAAAATLRAEPGVLYAEPDYLAYAAALVPVDTGSSLAATGIQPNDGLWIELWGLRRMGMPAAWELSTGDGAVLVAVVDSGIDLDHPEFAHRIIQGYDYVNRDTVPQDDFGHGTHTAGIIAASGDNGLGVAGVAWHPRLLVSKALDSQGVGPVSYVSEAVLDAAARGADIINLSLSLTGSSETLHQAIQYARSKGAVVVGAAGNQSGVVTFPGAYPEVIAVAATTRFEDWAGYSNYGPEVDIAAPGGTAVDPILSTSPGSGYAWLYGTSMATAHVTGLLALLLAVSPEMSADELAETLTATADKVGTFPYLGGRNAYLGYGRANAARALRQALAPRLEFAPPTLELLSAQGAALPSGVIDFANPSGQPLAWQLLAPSPEWLAVEQPWDGSLSYPESARLSVRVTAPLPIGDHTADLWVKTMTPGGQQVTYLVSIRLTIVPQLSTLFVPLVSRNHWETSWIGDGPGTISVMLDDDGAQRVPLPFDFPYYGRRYGQLWIHANGFLSFDQSYAGSQFAPNACIPALAAPDAAIYGLWDDLDPTLSGQVTYTAPADGGFAVTWRDVPRHGDNSPNTFQVVLWPDGRVYLTYLAVADPARATVGLENWDNTLGWQVACHGAGSPPAAGQSWQFHTSLLPEG
jgi:subtilisin family serine protease